MLETKNGWLLRKPLEPVSSPSLGRNNWILHCKSKSNKCARVKKWHQILIHAQITSTTCSFTFLNSVLNPQCACTKHMFKVPTFFLISCDSGATYLMRVWFKQWCNQRYTCNCSPKMVSFHIVCYQSKHNKNNRKCKKKYDLHILLQRWHNIFVVSIHFFCLLLPVKKLKLFSSIV